MADGTGRRIIAAAAWLALALGVVLRIVAYTQRSILWLDEAAVARNVVDRSLGQLLTVPLDWGQTAPKGFLALEWFATRALGTSDLAFRLVPFLSGIASLFLFYALARRVLEPAGVLVATLFFSVGYWFLVYSADVHPYGVDLAVSLGAVVLAIDVRRLAFPRAQVIALALFGAVAVWFSNATVLTLFGLGAALGVLAWRERGLPRAVRDLWIVALAWGTSAAGAVWVAKRSLFVTTVEYYDAIWRGTMLPVPRNVEGALSLWRAWRAQLALWHGWDVADPFWTSLYLLLALLGFASLLRRRTGDAVLLGSVVAAFVLLSMAKQYPYTARLVLISIAIFVVGIGESIGTLATAARGRGRIATATLAALVCVPPMYRVIAYPPPYQWTVVGDYLAQIRARWQPGDVLYTSYERALEVIFAAPRFGLTESDYVAGPCDAADWRHSLRTVDTLRGRQRAWVIVGPGRYYPLSPEYGYLRTIGVQRDSLRVRLPGSVRQDPAEPFDISTAYLFDVSDSTRLQKASAETFMLSPLQRPISRARPKWNCYGIWAATSRESGIGNRESKASPVPNP